MAAGMFRVISGVCRTMIIANTGGSLMLLLVFLLGGFVLPKRESLIINQTLIKTLILCNLLWSLIWLSHNVLTGDIPDWWVWGYWLSPLSYAFNALSVNEMLAPRWSKPVSTIIFKRTKNIFNSKL